MDIDICQLGMDQRKVNMLAREYAKNGKKPIVLSSHMVGGLKEGQRKMSKSDPDNAIFMADSPKDVKRKIMKAFCPEGVVEDNAALEFAKYFIFDYFGKFELKRLKDGEDQVYEKYEELVSDFADKKVHPQDLKSSLADQLNKILEPVRNHFKTNLEAKKIFELTKKYQEEYSLYKKRLEK